MRPQNLEREIQSLCVVCGITDVSTTRRNLTATCSDIHTRVCAHARNCLWQPRGTDVEPLGGAPNLEREIQSVCDVCGITDVDTTRHNLTATCSDIHTRACALARNCL